MFYYFKRDPTHSRRLQPLFKRAHMPSFKRAPKPLFKRAQKPLFKRAHKPLFKRAHKPLFRRAHKPLFKRAQTFVQEGTHLCSRQLKPLFTHVTACCGTQCMDFVFLLSPQKNWEDRNMYTDELVLYKMHLFVNSERQSGCGCVWNVVCLLLIKDTIK